MPQLGSIMNEEKFDNPSSGSNTPDDPETSSGAHLPAAAMCTQGENSYSQSSDRFRVMSAWTALVGTYAVNSLCWHTAAGYQ